MPNLLWVLVVILVVAMLAGWPGFGPWHHTYNYLPSGGIGFILLILIVVILLRGG